MKQADFRDMFEKASESVYTSTIVFPTVSTSSTMKTPENTQQDPEPADEGHILWGILLWLVVQPKYKYSNKKLPATTYVSVGNVW